MNIRSKLVAAGIFAMVCGQAVLGQDGRGVLVATPATVVTLEESGDSIASVGDLVRLPISYPIVPGAMISNLRVAVRGDSLRFVTVASTPASVGGRPVVGVGSLSAFVVAERSGDSIVTVTPVKLDGSDGEPREYRIRVGARKPPGR